MWTTEQQLQGTTADVWGMAVRQGSSACYQRAVLQLTNDSLSAVSICWLHKGQMSCVSLEGL